MDNPPDEPSISTPRGRGAKREPSLYLLGEGHGKGQELGCAALKNPLAHRGWNVPTARCGTGEMRVEDT